MSEAGIKFLLIQIDEAHSTAWPIGLPNPIDPQKTFYDRIERANDFAMSNKITDPFKVMIDGWDNTFANRFRAWPDKYYLIDLSYKIIAKSEYGKRADALIDVDCITLISNLINE